MKVSRSTTLSPVIISAIFTLLLSACAESNTGIDIETQMPADQNSSAEMQQFESSVPTDTGSSSMPTSSEAMQQSEAAVVPKQKYQDGTFTAAGAYRSPAGMEEVHITLVLKDDMIVSAIFEGTATNPKSKFMQSQFAAGFREAVVGKSIDSLSLTVVNGSSLTPMGFMDALAKIKVEAAV